MAAWSRTQIHLCDIVTSQIQDHKHDKHEDIEKNLDIFHILNGILAKTRNLIS